MHLRVLSCHPFKTFHCFHLGRSPIIIRPLWKLFSSSIWAGCPLQWNHLLRNPCISHHLQNLPFGLVAHYNETIFEKSAHFSPPPKCFHLGRSPIITRPLWKISAFSPLWKISAFSPLWKIFVFFTWTGRPLQQDHFEKSSHFSSLWKIFEFSPGQVAHYNKTTLKNLRIFHHFEKSLYFSPRKVAHYNKTTLKNLCIFHHFKKSSCFSHGQVAYYNKTTLKNLCIFHLFEKSLHFSHG